MLFIRLYLGMSIPWCGKIGKGKFPQSSLKAHFIFPSHGLAVMVKKNFPSRGFAAPGEIFVSPVAAPPLLGKLFFTNPAKPFLGKIKCAFRDSWGNFYFPFPIFPHHGIGPFSNNAINKWIDRETWVKLSGNSKYHLNGHQQGRKTIPSLIARGREWFSPPVDVLILN